MKTTLRTFAGVLLLACLSSAQGVVSAVHGTVTKIDSTTKTIVVHTADGTDHVVHFTARTTVHGAKATDMEAKDSFHGLKQGSEVVVHYTKKGTEESALEVDKVGKDGMKSTKGTVTHIDRGTKTLAIKTADGTEETFHMTDHAAADSGRDISKGTKKSAKVTVYYTEDAGKKVAHFFERF